MSKDEEIGTLIVVLLKARNLNDKHSFWKQDVYATVSLNGVTKKTHVEVKGGQHPVWDEEFRFPIMKGVNDKARVLEVACYAKEARSDDILGTGKVKIQETLHTGEFDDWVPLDINGVQRGDVYLEMTYFSNGPPPPPSPGHSVSSLLAPPPQQATTNLVRRASKLPANERLSRPPQALQPHRPSPSGSANSSRPSSAGQNASRKDELPAIPAGVPSALAAGKPKPNNANQPQSHSQPIAVPALLRPGGPGSTSPTYAQNGANNHGRVPSASPPSSTMPGGYPTSSQTHPRIPSGSNLGGGIPQQGSIHQSTYPNRINTHTPTPGPSPYVLSPPGTVGSPNPWGPSDSIGNISFPMPMGIAGGGPDPYDYRSPTTAPPPIFDQRPPIGLYQSPPPISNLPDPYLQARYHTPLPLPPGSPTSSVPSSSSYSSYTSSSSGSSTPYYQNSNYQNSNNNAHYSNPTTRQRTPSPPRTRRDPTPPRLPARSANEDRIIALQLAEEESFRRKEQEDKDLELALRLDRELNT